jgi:hypothetical protein
MATQMSSDPNFLFKEEFEDADIRATCRAEIGEEESERSIDLIFHFDVTVKGTREEFRFHVRGEMENPINILLWGSQILLHYGACVALRAGISGFKALKRAYKAAKDAGEVSRERVIKELREEKGRVQRDIAKALRGCVGDALFLGTIF